MRPLALALVFLLAVSVSGRSDDLQARPPISTLSNATAHTLQQGEWRVGSLHLRFSFPTASPVFRLSQLQWLGVEYGLTNRLQIGSTVLENVLEGPNVWAKFNGLRTRAWSLAMPLELDVDLSPFAAHVRSGLAVSWAPFPPSSLHAGFSFWAFDGQVQLSRVYAALEFELFPHTHLWVEADVWPWVVEVGTLSRYRMLHLQISSRVIEDADPHLDLELELFVRF